MHHAIKEALRAAQTSSSTLRKRTTSMADIKKIEDELWEAAIVVEITNLSGQIAAAREARNRLLPKLMSGEIEV